MKGTAEKDHPAGRTAAERNGTAENGTGTAGKF